MKSIYFIKKDSEGNITGTGQWHPGDAVNYTGHEQVSKKEWERINKDIVKPKREQEVIDNEARQYLEQTDWYVIREVETGTKCPDTIKQKRAQQRAAIKTESLMRKE